MRTILLLCFALLGVASAEGLSDRIPRVKNECAVLVHGLGRGDGSFFLIEQLLFRIITSLRAMIAILHTLGMFAVNLFKSQSRLEAENLLLRHQLSIAMRQAPPRLRLRGSDRALLVWMTRLWPNLLYAVQVVQPETVLRWHRLAFERSGAGSHETGQGGRRSIVAYAI